MPEAAARQLPENASDEEILNVIRDWVELLAVDDFEAAYAMLHHEPNDQFTPEFLRMWISNYGWHDPMKDGSTYRVTSCKLAVGRETHYQSVNRYDPADANGFAGDAMFDLPLNGEWSDLTALFWILSREGSLVLQLDDVHFL